MLGPAVGWPSSCAQFQQNFSGLIICFHSAACIFDASGCRIEFRSDICRAVGSPESEWPVATFAEELLSAQPRLSAAASEFRRQKYSKKKRPTRMGLIFIQIITKINTKWLNYAICIITNYYTIADCAPDKNLVRRTHIYLPQTD